ncbi:immunoglobulin kappa light chain-like [Protopterus annectens]|uniref:immunoglobulin kappa light chain-like n=1 Tax=Protopterus annectens TaxID=7888 RepID=UPI001CFAECB4|nr:immunoglobulin kappa light chain-like [Protopterus annectens]
MFGRVLLLFVCLIVVRTHVEQFPALVRVHPGDSVNLTCNISTFAVYCLNIVWYFQRYAERPQQRHREQESSESREQLNKMCILKISNLTITDSGTYFCSFCMYTASYFGNGTRIIVSGRTLTKPSIFITGPSQEMITLRLDVTLICLVYDPPESMQIYWNVSGKHLTGGMSPEIISAEGDYSITNDLTLSYDTWIKQPSIQCVTGEESKTYNYTKDKLNIYDSKLKMIKINKLRRDFDDFKADHLFEWPRTARNQDQPKISDTKENRRKVSLSEVTSRRQHVQAEIHAPPRQRSDNKEEGVVTEAV